MSIQDVVKNLNGMRAVTLADLNDDIVVAFGDYEFEGVGEIIISPSQLPGYDYQAYANHIDAPIVCIAVRGGRLEAWLA